jgi:hypothetical protein
MNHTVWINFDLHQIVQKKGRPDEQSIYHEREKLKNIRIWTWNEETWRYMADKIKVGLQTGCDDVDWIQLAQDGDYCEQGNEPSEISWQV